MVMLWVCESLILQTEESLIDFDTQAYSAGVRGFEKTCYLHLGHVCIQGTPARTEAEGWGEPSKASEKAGR